MKRFLLAAVFTGSLLSSGAQFTYDYLKAADDYYKKGDYYSAAQYYEKYLNPVNGIKTAAFKPYAVKENPVKGTDKSTGKDEVYYKLAESYRLLNYYSKAEPYYAQVIQSTPAKYPLVNYHYATTLRALGKFGEAEAAFQQFLAGYPTTDNYSEAALREIQNLSFIQSQLQRKDLAQYKIDTIKAFSSQGANYAPFWTSAASVYFTTTRPDSTATKAYINRLYEAQYERGSFSTPAKVTINQPADIHQGGSTVSTDGSLMLVTRWKAEEKRKQSAIYISRMANGSWSEPMLLKGLSVAAANDKQPLLLPDGQLIFASDREGGQGGFDLWTATISSAGEVAGITNLGTAINTKFDEEAPSYHLASNTLVFASNGRVGMGGFDLFFSKNVSGAWATPENFGYPVNSIKNDMYFASKGNARNILENVLLSSDRSAECCLQLFALSKVKNPKMVSGSVVDCQTNMPLSDASVQVIGANNQPIFTGTTGNTGLYKFNLEEFENLRVTGELKGYTTKSISATAPSNDALESIVAPTLCLNKIPEVGTVEVLENVYFEYGKAEVLDESFASLNKLVKKLVDNPTVSIEISGHTDSMGDNKFNQKLSEARAKSVVDYIVNQGIDRSRLVAKGYGEAKPIMPNSNEDGSDNPAGREKNRRTEFKVIKN